MNKQIEWLARCPYFWRQLPLLRRLVLVMVATCLLGSGLYFTLRLPVVQRLGGGVILLAQTLRSHFEQMAATYFGREVLLRQRTRQLLQQMEGEIDRLHWMEVESTTIAVTLETNLRPLRNQQTEARLGLHQLASAVDGGELMEVNGQPLSVMQVEAVVAEKLQVFAALQAQVDLYQQTAQLHAATAIRAAQLQTEAHEQAANLAAYLTLFEATGQIAERAGPATDEQLTAIRVALQAQIVQGERIVRARQVLEKSLHERELKLEAVDRLLLDSAELAAQLHQLTAP
ncbi:hypothetical protein BH10CHL1_BH10CHL1_44860 [soil metagenome]